MKYSSNLGRNRRAIIYYFSSIILFLSILLFNGFFINENITDFYYYKNKPLYINVRTDKIFIKTKDLKTKEELTGILRAYNLIAPADRIDNGEKMQFINLKTPVTKASLSDLIKLLNQNPNIEYSSPVYSPVSGSTDNVLQGLTDEILVQFKPVITETEIGEYLRKHELSVKQKLDLTGGISYVLKVPKILNMLSIDAANMVYNSGLVNWSEPNFYISGLLCFTPNDQYYPYQWALKNTGTNIPGGILGTAGCDIRVDSAWDLTTGISQCIIGMIDSGIDTTHEDLKANLLISRGYDFINGHPYPMDDNGHGTVTAGIVAAIQNNQIGISGVAPGCKLLPIKVFNSSGNTTSEAIANGLIYSYQQGAWISNNSWVGGTPISAIDQAISDGVNFGRSGKGIVFCFAAGNGNSPYIEWPSSNPNVISIGGVSPCNTRKSPTSCDGETNWGANYGTGLSIVAPSVKIYSTKLPVTYDSEFSGTSCSAPYCSGICALALVVDSLQRWDSLRIRLCKSADKIGQYDYNTIGPYNVLGNTWNNEMGYGLINSFKLLKLVKKSSVPHIIHYKLNDTEQITGDRTVNCVIIPEHIGINPSLTRLYYRKRKSNWSNINFVNSGGNNWTSLLTLSGPGIYDYYIFTTDSLNNIATSPEDAPENFYTFTAVIDTINPEITNLTSGNFTKIHWPEPVFARVTDNIGIDSVWIKWYINNPSTGIREFRLNFTNENNYSSLFNSVNSDVNVNDSIFYRIFARDYSSNHNTDSTLLFKTKIVGTNNVCIGTGSLGSQFPFRSQYSDARIQMMFYQSEFLQSLYAGNYIVRIGFNFTYITPHIFKNFTVRFQHTNLSMLLSFVSSGWTTAYSGMYNLDDTITGWRYIDLNTPYFSYDYLNNLLVDICFDNDSAGTIDSYIMATTISNVSYGMYTNNSNGCDFIYGFPMGFRPNICFVMANLTNTNRYNNFIPRQYTLKQNYPNPFNPVTKICYDIPKQEFVTLRIYDILGREINTLVSEIKAPGSYSVDFNSSELSSGIYFYRIQAGEFIRTKKMMLVK